MIMHATIKSVRFNTQIWYQLNLPYGNGEKKTFSIFFHNHKKIRFRFENFFSLRLRARLFFDFFHPYIQHLYFLCTMTKIKIAPRVVFLRLYGKSSCPSTPTQPTPSSRLHVAHLMHTKKKLENFLSVQIQLVEWGEWGLSTFLCFSCTHNIRLSVPFLSLSRIVSVRVVSAFLEKCNKKMLCVEKTIRKKVPKMHT